MQEAPIHYSPLAMAGYRALHRASVGVRDVLRSPWLNKLEFELRYRRYLAEFGESESDVLVSTFSKSGTTWMQLILYQLTTHGSMAFDHLFDISPWVWYAALREVTPTPTQQPRLLKSHDSYARFSKGRRGRFVFVVRDGRDVCLSLFHHRRNFKRFDGTFEQHFEEFINGTDYNWFDHVQAWVENASQLPITYVRFEDLKNDFNKTVVDLAHTLSIPVDETLMARVTAQCSFESMKRNEYRFAPRNAHFAGRSDAPYHVRSPDQFIRHGQVGEGRAMLSPEQLAVYGARFDRSLAGFPLLAGYR